MKPRGQFHLPTSALVILINLAACREVVLFNGDGRAARDDLPLPTSIRRLVDTSDIIVKGTVIRLVSAGDIGIPSNSPFPTLDPSLANSTEPVPAPTEIVVPMTLTAISVDEVLFVRNPIRLNHGDVVTMSQSISLSLYATPTPTDLQGIGPIDALDVAYRMRMAPRALLHVGDQRLFLLRKEVATPLASFFGPLWGAYSILDINESHVMLSTTPPLQIDITDNPSPSAFLEELSAAIHQQ